MALLVLMVITVPRISSISFWWNTISSALGLNVSANLNSSISFIAHDYTTSQLNAFENIYRYCAIIDITGRKEKMYGVPKRVNYGVNLCVSPTA